ncbi:MAG TPA: trigger factor, partial [Beijerinckiaceae bacterium]|nr:trigger factor [Beijerinckiaceae bacterium]
MEVTETLSQGLKREFKVVLPAQDLATRLEQQLSDLKGKVRINGFRPGKVPVAHLRRLYGKSVMADIVQEAVTEANRKIVEDNGIRLALEPKIDFPGDKAAVENALEAKGDLAFTVNVEVLPKFEIGAFDDLALDRDVAPIADSDVDEALQRLVENNRTFNPREDGAAAMIGDKVSIDFVGKLDGTAFEGGSGTDVDLILGSNSFIPGFESQLEGAKAGEQRLVKVRFPDDYQAAHLAAK